MDRTAFSFALGILAFVLSYSCVGIDWAFSLSIAAGTTLATRIAHRVLRSAADSTVHDFKRETAQAVCREGILGATTAALGSHAANGHVRTSISRCHGF